MTTMATTNANQKIECWLCKNHLHNTPNCEDEAKTKLKETKGIISKKNNGRESMCMRWDRKNNSIGRCNTHTDKQLLNEFRCKYFHVFPKFYCIRGKVGNSGTKEEQQQQHYQSFLSIGGKDSPFNLFRTIYEYFIHELESESYKVIIWKWNFMSFIGVSNNSWRSTQISAHCDILICCSILRHNFFKEPVSYCVVRSTLVEAHFIMLRLDWHTALTSLNLTWRVLLESSKSI